MIFSIDFFLWKIVIFRLIILNISTKIFYKSKIKDLYLQIKWV